MCRNNHGSLIVVWNSGRLMSEKQGVCKHTKDVHKKILGTRKCFLTASIVGREQQQV